MRKVTDWLLFFFMAVSLPAFSDDNVIDEVVWIIGDEAIYKSEVEEQYRQMQYDGQRIDGDPYCVIPEQLAVQKLFLHQAKLDTITVPDATVFQQVEARINYLIANIGSKEKMEEYFKKPVTEIREELANVIRDQGTVQEVQRNLVKDVKTTPAEVRKFYNQLPADSIPYIPMQVEVQIITLNPKVPQQEIDNVKARLRDFSEQVNKGERDFSTLAVLYSEDRGSAMMGGEMGFVSKSNLVPEFANVAFNLNDPKKVSKIVETEYGYHIIQLIEKRGDRINVRHILLRPHVSEKDISDALIRLDSLRVDLIDKKISFDEITQYVSQDKDTRNNKGLMVNPQTGNSKFEMGQLPQDGAIRVFTMNVMKRRFSSGVFPGAISRVPVSVPSDQLLCLPEPLTPLKGFSCSSTRNPCVRATFRINDMMSMLWSTARLHSSKIGANSNWLGATSLWRVFTGIPNSSAWISRSFMKAATRVGIAPK